MSRVDELIKKLCPNGVEYIQLGHLEDSGAIQLGRGKVISKKAIAESPGPYPVYSSSASFNGEFGRCSEYMFEDERITWSIDGGGRFFYRPPHKYSVTNVCGWLSVKGNNLDTRYLFYVLDHSWAGKSFDYTKKAHPSTIRVEYTIPVPPLEIQQEIARILDKFTQLEAELEAELEARRKQYAYYREQLLTFPETGGQPLKLADVCRRISTGSTPKAGSRKYYENGTIPWLRTAEVSFNTIYSTETAITEAALAETGVSWVEAQSIVVAISGATAGRSAVTAIPLTTNQHCCNMAIDSEKADFRYVFHWLGAHYEDLKQRGRGARADLNLSIIKNFPIVLPPLEEQRRIVAILDKFDALVNDISTGLPAEIAARRKQYEYYRDKLLSFEPV
ncbi:restriction endonuclease subunit S [Corynebacterium pseudodiphtheriticum]|uniref:restriction endonuclease subunit S n=1 Tax=Corynebacterium pseudodiphtheriticum TaxID=37637 RepID=UPI00254EDBEB|nr:restriction endonuclease subunit S [Corynebacterium pseudodiphtheriticum]MDK8717580.1 restriction endonuclease subunit S [Corynebacterium pseudodiphtheriticum]